MKCPFCSHRDSRVIDSRAVEEGCSIRRRRECPNCGKRFTTYEKYEETPLVVSKKDGRRELFDGKKLLAGLLKACEKRPVPYEKIKEIADSIERVSGADGSDCLCTLCFRISSVRRCAQLYAGAGTHHAEI